MRNAPPVEESSSGILRDVMGWVRVHGTVFFRATLGAPWGFTVPRRKNATFHFVASGECWLDGDGIHGPYNSIQATLSSFPMATATRSVTTGARPLWIWMSFCRITRSRTAVCLTMEEVEDRRFCSVADSPSKMAGQTLWSVRYPPSCGFPRAV